MNLQKKITYATLFGVTALSGCDYAVQAEGAKNQPTPEYFARVPSFEGIVITSGDFDGDSDLDIIVTTRTNDTGYLYLFKNDGKGNFSQKTPEKESE